MRLYKENPTAYLNFLRAQYEAMTGQLQVKSHPYIMFVDPSSICQLRCPGCPTGVENESKRIGQPISLRERTMMTSDLYDSILDEIGQYLFCLQLYNWGEPLLHRQLPAFVRKAKEYQVCVVIHTNLSLHLTDAYLEELLESGLDVIAASVDGFSPEPYQTYRRGGNFELVKTNVERLAAMRNRLNLQTEIIWNFLVFRWNEHEVGAARRFCDETGIVFKRGEAYVQDPEWLPSYRQQEAEGLGRTTRDSARPHVPRREWCNWHYTCSVVNSNGSISPCCAPWEQQHDFGLLEPGKIRFGDIWNNELYQKSRGAFANRPVPGLGSVDSLCLRCPFGTDVQSMNSHIDDLVIDRSPGVFRGRDSLLEEAFRQLPNRERFLDYYSQHMDELHATDTEYKAPLQPPRSERPLGLLGWPLKHSFRLWLRRVRQRALRRILRLANRYPGLYAGGYIARYRWGRILQRFRNQ